MNAVWEEEATAFHESAHATIHRVFAHSLDYITIEGSGRCVLANRVQRLREKEIGEIARRQFEIENIICLLAAHHAEVRCFGDSASPGSKGDHRQAFKIALGLNDGDEAGAELLIRWLDHRARLLVERHWESITRLSLALLEHDKLNAEQIREVLE